MLFFTLQSGGLDERNAGPRNLVRVTMIFMKSASPDPGRPWRFLWAVAISFLITAVLSVVYLIGGSFFPGAWTIADFYPLGITFVTLLLFWYFTWVRRTRKMLEFEKLARQGEELLRR